MLARPMFMARKEGVALCGKKMIFETNENDGERNV